LGNLIFALLFLFVGAFAQAQEVNLLKNPNFESRTSGWSKTGSSTLTVESGTPLEGVYSINWDASATGEFFRSGTYTIPAGMRGKTCLIEMLYSWDAGTSGHILMNVDDGTNNVATMTVAPTASSVAGVAQLNFTCPTSGTVRFELESTANATSIRVDKTFVGAGRNSAQLSQAVVYATADYQSDCDWNTSSSTTSFPVGDATCSTPTTTGTISITSDGTGERPGFTLPNAPPGRYEIRWHTNAIWTTDSTTHTMELWINGNDRATALHSGPPGSANDREVTPISYIWDHTTTSTITVEIRTADSGGNNYAMGLGKRSTFTVTKYPTTSAESLTLETTGWKVDANISGNNIQLSTGVVASYTAPNNASLSLTTNPGSLPTFISCSSTNDATGTTCSAGNEEPGISFSVPTAGDVQVCASFTHFLDAPAGSINVETYFQLVETANTSQTIVQEGKSRIGHHAVSLINDQRQGVPFRLCGNFNFASAGRKTIRLMYEQDVSGVADNNTIQADAAGAYGQRDIHFEAYPLNQQMPAPIFTELRNNVKTGTEGIKICAIEYQNTITVAGPSQPTRDYTLCNGTGITRASTGIYTQSIAAGFFSGAPSCWVTCNGAPGNCNCTVNGTATTTSVPIACYVADNAAAADSRPNIFCVGPK